LDKDCPEAVALAHAVIRWQAETENATRLSHRENGILAVIATILGLGLFKGADLRPCHPWWLYTGMMVAASLTLLFLLFALFQVLWIPQSNEGTKGGRVVETQPAPEGESEERPRVYASENLAWPRDPALHPTALESAKEAYAIAYKRVTKAANSLGARNSRRKAGIEFGQRFLFAAAVAATFSIVLYAFLDPGASKRVAGKDAAAVEAPPSQPAAPK